MFMSFYIKYSQAIDITITLELNVRLSAWLVLAVLPVLSSCSAPRPVTLEQLSKSGTEYLSELREEMEGLEQPLTLDAALARALTHNLEFRVRSLRRALASGNATLASFSMLPNLTARAGYEKLSNSRASLSRSVETGAVSLVPSTSRELETGTYSFELSWNMLDFGLAWLRARSRGEEVLLAEEERRRAVHLVTRDLFYAWERALAFQQIEQELVEVDALVRSALEQSTEIMRRRLRDPIQVLEYRKSLLLVLKRINVMMGEMEKAEAELARLLNLPAGMELTLADRPGPLHALDSLEVPLQTWQAAALLYRPEVRSSFYQVRNAERSHLRRMLEAFPELVLRYSDNFNSNQFLVDNHWTETGANISWGLINLASLPARHRQGKLEEKLANTQQELQMTAVLSQVAVSTVALEHANQGSCISSELADVDEQKMSLLRARENKAALDRLSVIKARVDHLLLKIERGLDEAERKRALLMLLASAGISAVPESLEVTEPEAVRNHLSAWLEKGLSTTVMALLQSAREVFGESLEGGAPVRLGGSECFAG